MPPSNGSRTDTGSESRREHDAAIAFCLLNLKGAKEKDFIGTAQRLRFLKGLPEYGSNARVAEVVGVSPEIVREFLTLLQLPESVQMLLAERRLNLEQGRRLWQLARTRPEIVEQTARAMVDMSAMDARHLVEYIRKHPELSVDEAKQQLVDSKTIMVREYHVVAMLAEKQYKSLEREARKRHTSVNRLVSELVTDWLAEVSDER